MNSSSPPLRAERPPADDDEEPANDTADYENDMRDPHSDEDCRAKSEVEEAEDEEDEDSIFVNIADFTDVADRLDLHVNALIIPFLHQQQQRRESAVVSPEPPALNSSAAPGLQILLTDPHQDATVVTVRSYGERRIKINLST